MQPCRCHHHWGKNREAWREERNDREETGIDGATPTQYSVGGAWMDPSGWSRGVLQLAKVDVLDYDLDVIDSEASYGNDRTARDRSCCSL